MSVIQLTVSCTVSLVQLTVQCCIQTVCCGFQFVLQFVTFNLLLRYVCHSVDCQLYCQFGSADNTVLIQTVCCGFQFVLQFVTFNLLLQYVIQLTVSCTCCKYRFSILRYSGKLFSVSFLCKRCRETISLLTVF